MPGDLRAEGLCLAQGIGAGLLEGCSRPMTSKEEPASELSTWKVRDLLLMTLPFLRPSGRRVPVVGEGCVFPLGQARANQSWTRTDTVRSDIQRPKDMLNPSLMWP